MKSDCVPWLITREHLVKAEEATSLRYGFEPAKRPLKDYLRLGIVNLDKTSGPSSHEVAAWVKRILKIPSAGHGGTLEATPK